VGADKRTGATVVKTDAGEAQVIEPLAGGLETIAFFELFERGVVKSPHTLIRQGDGEAE
jgi:hypothetical protein